MKKKKSPRKKLITLLDAQWSKLTKAVKESRCEWCYKFGPVQSDHIVNRHKYPTRWRLENCVLLCVGCHLFRKKREPFEWSQMVVEKIGQDRLDFLKEVSNSNEKTDLDQVKRYLENAAEEIKPFLFGGKA